MANLLKTNKFQYWPELVKNVDYQLVDKKCFRDLPQSKLSHLNFEKSKLEKIKSER